MDEKYRDCAILVLDYYPQSCMECLMLYGGCDMKRHASSVEELNSQRDYFCPIQSVAEMVEVIEDDTYDSKDYIEGCMSCLEDIVSDRHVKFD